MSLKEYSLYRGSEKGNIKREWNVDLTGLVLRLNVQILSI